MAWRHGLTRQGIGDALLRTVDDVTQKHTFQMAAALSYYFVLALFPALILLSAVLAYLPVQNLFEQAITLMSGFVPSDGMRVVKHVLGEVVAPNRGTLLSFAILGIIWTASGGFASTIEALNIAYEVEEGRKFWVTRPIAVALTVIVGLLLLTALAVLIVGPEFGQKLARHHILSWVFAAAWPYIHWIASFALTVLAVEVVYFVAPNVKQRFWSTLPGALLVVICWELLSYGLGIYFRSFAHFNKTYGAMGAVIVLMVWLYWNSFILLVGAELNCELAKETAKGKIKQDEDQSGLTKLDIAA